VVSLFTFWYRLGIGEYGGGGDLSRPNEDDDMALYGQRGRLGLNGVDTDVRGFEYRR